MNYKIGDIIYLNQAFCIKNRVDDIPRKILNFKYYRKHFDEDEELDGYTISYGTYGWDVRLTDVDHIRTQREIKLNNILA